MFFSKTQITSRKNNSKRTTEETLEGFFQSNNRGIFASITEQNFEERYESSNELRFV